MESRFCFIISLVYSLLLPVVISVFDEPIDGPQGSLFLFDYKRNHLHVFDVPSGDLRSYLRVPAYDVCYWPKERSVLYAYSGREIRKFDIWGDLSDTLIVNRDQLEITEYWVYVRLEIRENWLLGGAVDVSTSRLNLYRINVNSNMTASSILLLASENVTAAHNLIIQPTMSPENRHVYAVNTRGIFRVPYDGGPTEQIIVDPYAYNPAVIVQEHRLFFVSGENRNAVKSCDLDGGGLATIYNSSFPVGAADQYGDWLVISEENGLKEYQFINLTNTNDTRKILNVPYDGSAYLVRRLDFWALGEVCKTHSLLNPAVVRARHDRKVTVTTAVSSAGGVQYQYLTRFERLASTGTISGLSPSSEHGYLGLQPAKLVLESKNSKKMDARTGVYLQKVITPYGDEETVSIVIQSPGKLRFNKPTVTVNVGDNVTLSVPKPIQRHIRWRHNGRLIPEWSRRRSATIVNVTMADEGVYESYLWLRRKLGRHGVMRLIVRGCPSGYCNPPNCTEECPFCYNGGVPLDSNLHDNPCVCPPGFMGNYCKRASPVGRFGEEGELSCPDDDCKGVLICQPDPYGCSCAAGYRGPGCNKRCRGGTFGANCELVCHCHDNQLCDRRTGSCEKAGGCQIGWSGGNCQIPTFRGIS